MFCNLTGSEEFFFERVALAFPKDSSWIEHFNIEIKRILQVNKHYIYESATFKIELMKQVQLRQILKKLS